MGDVRSIAPDRCCHGRWFAPRSRQGHARSDCARSGSAPDVAPAGCKSQRRVRRRRPDSTHRSNGTRLGASAEWLHRQSDGGRVPRVARQCPAPLGETTRPQRRAGARRDGPIQRGHRPGDRGIARALHNRHRPHQRAIPRHPRPRSSHADRMLRNSQMHRPGGTVPSR